MVENNIKTDFTDTVVKVNNIKTDFIETVVEGVEWINFAHDRSHGVYYRRQFERRGTS